MPRHKSRTQDRKPGTDRQNGGIVTLTKELFQRQNKAVIYQWESRKRCPSPVFWQRIEALAARL